jgi:uncharacterized protein (DUF58 family)
MHDDVRHIDWNVTARLQVPHVRQFTEDRDLAAWFLLDLSGSVDFGSADVTKLGVSDRLRGHAGAAAHPPRQPRGRPALWHAASTPCSPRRRAPAMCCSCCSACASRRPAPRQGGSAGPRAGRPAARRPKASCGAASLVFVVSDFISEPGWEQPLGRLARRHEVVAVRLFDPLEWRCPTSAW